MAQNKKVRFQEVLYRVVNGDNEALKDLVTYKDRWVNGKKKKYLQRFTYYNVYRLHKLYQSCLESFHKLTAQEIESLFQSALYEFACVEIAQKQPNSVGQLRENALINWAEKYIRGYMVEEMDNVFGKVRYNHKGEVVNEKGEVIEKPITIVHEQINHNQHYGNDEDTTDSSLYDQASFEAWDRKNTYISFGDFLKDMEQESKIRAILSDVELAAYPKLIKLWDIENQKTYGYSHIGRELNVDESRIRYLEKNIGEKLLKLLKVWVQTRKRKSVPLSHELREFVEIFSDMIQFESNENELFKFLLSWLRVQYKKEMQMSFKQFHKNNTRYDAAGIMELLQDNDSELKQVFKSFDDTLRNSTYITLCGLIEGTIDHKKVRKDVKRTIINRCLNVFYTYLNNFDKDVKTLIKYNTTYKETQREKDHVNKGHFAEKHFNKIVIIKSDITENGTQSSTDSTHI